MKVSITLPKWAKQLIPPHRYKVIYGGRGGGKSHTVARLLLVKGMEKPLRILCAREIQKSIRESVHKLLSDLIEEYQLGGFYRITESSIKGVNGTEFFFVGLRTMSVSQIKSYEGVDICWVEEGQVISKRSWDILIPTIRKEGSEIWITFNPDLETDETYQRFVMNPPEDWVGIEVNWRDNPWFPETLNKERVNWQINHPESYENVWEGKPRAAVEGAFYSEEIRKAFEEGRITHVPVVDLPVHTAWDLGIGQNMAIWFFQIVGQEIHLVDYVEGLPPGYEEYGAGLKAYAKLLQDKGYVYGQHFAPHDIKVRELGTGLSRYEKALSLGLKFTILPTDKISIADGIELVRGIFSRCWFDKERCKYGLDCLRNYKSEWDEKHGVPKSVPVHDYASHGADAFRYVAIAVERQHHSNEGVTAEEAKRLYETYGPPAVVVN